MMDLLHEERFGFISDPDREFITAFDEEMNRLGYDFGGKIGSGYCWGKYMLIYRKTGVKSERVYARIYLREESTVLRFFFVSVDDHRKFIENAPGYIKEIFVGENGKCQHCHNETDGFCRFRKSYTIDDRLIEKCSGITFEVHHPSLQRLSGYMDLFCDFYPSKKK